MAAHNWAILLLSFGFLWETGGRWRKTQAWLWRQTGTICCTYPPAHTLHSPISMNSLIPSASCTGHLLLSAWSWYTQALLTHCRCQVWASLNPAPWWVIKHIAAYRHSQWDPASQPRDMCSFSIAGAHLPPAPFLKLICHISEARKLPGWVPPPFELNGLNTIRRGCVKNGIIWIACELPHHLLLLVFCDRGPQAMICFFFLYLQVLTWWFLFHTRDDWKC